MLWSIFNIDIMKKKNTLLLFLCLFSLWAVAQEKKPVKIACVGNSITYGSGIKNQFQNSYPGLLSQLLGEGYDVRNFGISARVLLNKGDHPYMHEQKFRDLLAFQPDIVTIKLGTNDSKPWNWRYGKDFKKDLTEMLDILQELPSKPKIYLCLPVPAEYSIYEVVQRWISPKGTTTTVARLRGMSILYYDLWAEYSDMEVRKNNKLRAYDINPVCTYPRQRFIPELKRNGFNGEYHNILPYDLFTAILSDSRSETLLKAGQYPMLRHYIRSSFDIERYWASVKICIRNGYTIADGSMWRDTIDLLRLFGKDTNSPKYVCPSDLKAEHDRLMHKRNKEIERKKLEERIRQAKKHEKAYRKLKGIFFGIAFTDGTLQVRVLESVAEFAAEGTELHHCVFSNSYFLEKNSLILSATIDGKRIETVEVSLKTLEVVQSRGLHNSNTEYHDRIVNLVNSNVNLIRQRMEAA